MKKNNIGQAMMEALFVVVFTTIIMFAFLQICIMVVDDMTANEAAFVAMRSAAVTKGENKRAEEAEVRAKRYLNTFYTSLFSLSSISPVSALDIPLASGSFKFSDRETVKQYYIGRNRDGGNNTEAEEEYNDEAVEEEGSGASVKMYNYSGSDQRYQNKRFKDFSGYYLSQHTVKIYYFTRVMFGSIVAKKTSNARGTSANDKITKAVDKFVKISGNRRYQSARSRMIPSPDSNYYYKAYPGARKFDEE